MKNEILGRGHELAQAFLEKIKKKEKGPVFGYW